MRDNVLIAAGGEGGMALVVDFATSMIATIVRREVKVMEYVQAFILAVRSYIPPEEATPEDSALNGWVGSYQLNQTKASSWLQLRRFPKLV